MSSWLVSLRWIGGCMTCSGRCLEKRGLGPPCVLDGFFDISPRRLMAEARSKIIQEQCDLCVAHAVCEAGHDRAAFALDRPHARQHDIGEIARIGRADRGAEAEIDPAIGWRPAALMAGPAGRGVNR